MRRVSSRAGLLDLVLGGGIIAALAFATVLAFHPGTTSAQTPGDVPEAGCPGAGNKGFPPFVDVPVPAKNNPPTAKADFMIISNLQPVEKRVDITLIKDDNTDGYLVGAERILRKQPNIDDRIKKITTVQGAVDEINNAYNANNPRRKLNIFIVGHGFPGQAQIGNDVIGNESETQRDKQKIFINGAKGKIEHLKFIECYTGFDARGQAFLNKLRMGLGAARVSGFTNKVWQIPNVAWPKDFAPFPYINGTPGPFDQFFNKLVVQQPGGKKDTSKPDGAGVLSGLFDACAGTSAPAGPCTYNPSPATTAYACMVRTDEDSTISGGQQAMKSSLACGSTASLAIGAGMPPCGLWHGPGPQGANPVTNTVPGEGDCGARAGYSAGPPYTSLAPYKLNGFYCQSGPCTAPDGSSVPTDGTWQIGCLADFGTTLGPNVVVKTTSTNAVATNPTIGNSNTNNATVYIAATNSQCTNAQAGTWDVTLAGNGTLALVSTLTRRATTRVYTGVGTCTDMDKLWQNKPGSATKCPQDPFNPYAVEGSSEVSGTWDITAEAIRADVGAPGFYYNCITDIQQSGKNLTARLLCYIDSAGITVNPQAASGNSMTGVNSCGPAAAKFCGDGLPAAAPPGCAQTAPPCATLAGQGAGCPSLPCDVSQYQFADVDNKHTVLTGTLDNISNNINLAGCFSADPPEGDGLGQLGNVYVVAKFDAHTGIGKANIYVAETRANCVAGTPTGGGGIVQVAAVRQAPGNKTGGCVANVGLGYTGCRDGDGDGCPDKRELGDTQGGPTGGGLRDPMNPFDFFNPEKVNTPHAQTVADILKVVGQYGKNQGNAAYQIDTDRTALIGGNVWNLGPPDGQQSVADILAAVKQYNHNC